MLTLNAIISEIKDVPVDRLEELYQFVQSISLRNKKTERNSRKILSFGGAFNEMSDFEYEDYLNYLKKSRNTIFARNIEL